MSGGLRMSLADLTQTRAWADPRNRQRLAEAAGLPFHPQAADRPSPGRSGPCSRRDEHSEPPGVSQGGRSRRGGAPMGGTASLLGQEGDTAPPVAAPAFPRINGTTEPSFHEPVRPRVDPPDWLVRLMACPPFAGRLDPEQHLSAQLAADCRRWTLSGELRAVWSCHPAEVRVGGRLGQCWQAMLVSIGVVPGSSDYVFTWDTGALWLELKVEDLQTDLLRLRRDGTARAPRRTYLRGLQPDFREWCRSLGVAHEVCRSRGDWTAALRRHGRLA